MNRDLLSLYLIENGCLPLDEIGVLQIRETPSAFDITTNAVSAPDFQIIFSQDDEVCAKQPLMRFLSRTTNCTEEEAYQFFREFLKEVEDSLDKGIAYQWKGLGSFNKLNNEVVFEPEDTAYLKASPVSINRLSVLAGASMSDNLNDTTAEPFMNLEEQVSVEVGEAGSSPYRWLIGAAILFVIGAALIAMRQLHIW